MSDQVEVFGTTGAVSIAVSDDYVNIFQANLMGEEPDAIGIPRPLFKEVLSYIFARLDVWELQEISELCDTHAKAITKDSKA